MQFPYKKALITGGAGYIGSKLSLSLAEKGVQVIVTDIARSKHLTDHPNIAFHKIDIRDRKALDAVMDGVDIVYHLAFIQVDSNLPHTVQRDVDINGTRTILDLSVKHKIKKFVHTSTIELYGQRPVSPITEESPQPVDSPLNYYALMKIEAETLVWTYYREFGLPVVAMRFPIVCGKGFYALKGVLVMIERLSRGKVVPVIGSGNYKFNTAYLDDVIESYHLASTKPAAVGHAFNVATTDYTTVNELIKAAKEKLHSRSGVVHIPYGIALFVVKLLTWVGIHLVKPTELAWLNQDVVFDTTKAQKILGYKPTKNTLEAFLSLAEGYLEDAHYIKHRSTDAPFRTWSYLGKVVSHCNALVISSRSIPSAK